MKFDELRSIGHNIADSLASGIGLPIGYYSTDVFAEARRSRDGFIVVDFLHGKCTAGAFSPSLARAIALYRNALVRLCERHGTSISAFHELTARYTVDRLDRRFVVSIENERGRRRVDEYVGMSGRRVKVRDHLGRVRRK
jgi:hypothetical protein